MRHAREVRLALEILRSRLSGWTPSASTRSVPHTFLCPPVLTNIKISGIKLGDLMIPPCYTPLVKLVEIFDQLIWWHNDGAPEEYRDRILDGLQGRARRFVGVSPERFVVWAGGHRDARLASTGGDLIVEGEVTFGIADGNIFSHENEFAWPNGVDSVYQETIETTRDTGFISLWERAEQLKDAEAKMLLAAVKVGSQTSINKMAPWVRTRKLKISAGATGALIEKSDDPIADLYRSLVPLRLNRGQFERMFGRLADRPLHLDDEMRKKLWDKCCRNDLV